MTMKQLIALVLAVTGIVGTSRAYAQEASPGPGRMEVTIIPAGGVYFTENKDTQEPSFGNFTISARPTS
jgi:hypothetical protein